MKNKNPEFLEYFEKLMKEDGSTYCEKCSTQSWKMYHTPGNPCPETHAANSLKQEGA